MFFWASANIMMLNKIQAPGRVISCQDFNRKLGSKLANLGLLLWLLLLVLSAVVLRELLPWRQWERLLILARCAAVGSRAFYGHHPKWSPGELNSSNLGSSRAIIYVDKFNPSRSTCPHLRLTLVYENITRQSVDRLGLWWFQLTTMKSSNGQTGAN